MALLGLIGIGLALAVVIGSIVGLSHMSLPSKVRELENELSALRKRVRTLEGEPSSEARPTTDVAQSAATETVSDSVPGTPERPANESATPEFEADTIVRTRSFSTDSLRRIEGRFASYWTGILGVLATVAGFGFLAILTALRLGEFARFVMLAAVSAAFWGGSLFIERRTERALFAAWFRSAAGALFLFACLGSATIPWLRWVQSEPQGYALLAAGLAVNLYFALNGRYQLFTAFHTLISLTALAIAPPVLPVLASAAIVFAVCSLPSLHRTWPFHLVLAELAFFAFIVAWALRAPGAEALTDGLAWGALALGLAPVLVGPYVLRTDAPAGRNLTARAAAWLMIGLGTAALARSLRGVSIVFALSALVAYLPRRFSERGDAATRRLDTIAGLLLASSAALGLLRFDLDLGSALTVVTLIALVAAADMRKDRVISRTAMGTATLSTLASVVLLFAVTVTDVEVVHFGTGSGLQALVSTIVVGLVVVAGLATLFRKDRIVQTLAVFTLAASAVGSLLVGYATETIPDWLDLGGVTALVPIAIAVMTDRRRTLPYLPPIVLVFAVWVHVSSLLYAGTIEHYGLFARLGHAALLAGYSGLSFLVAGVREDKRRIPVWPSIFLATADAVVILGILTQRFDAWTMLVLVSLQSIGMYALRRRLHSERSDLVDSITGAGATVAFLTALVNVTGAIWGEFEYAWALRILQYLTALGALVIWVRRDVREEKAPRTAMLLTATAFLLAIGITETGIAYGAIVLLTGSVLFFFIGSHGPRFLSGALPLSVVVFWVGLAVLPIASIDPDTYRITSFGADWWRAIAAAGLATAYIGSTYAHGVKLRKDIAEEGRILSRFKRFVSRNVHRALFLPFFLSLGLFFTVSARGPVLTSLLIIECFSLFALGILLKEASFRPFSYGVLLLSLVRLLFLDLVEADTLERALVFLIAGAVLLGMNWLYNRFDHERSADG